MVNNKKFKIISITFGLMLLIAGVLLIVFKPNVFIAYPIALIGTGGYLCAVSLASLLFIKMYYSDRSAAVAQRNKHLRIIEILTYSILGSIMAITIILCFTLLR